MEFQPSPEAGLIDELEIYNLSAVTENRVSQKGIKK
jgi:hypothetical protein